MKRQLLTLLFAGITLIVKAQNKVTINTSEGKHIISRHIYGHFAEHLGRCIYDGFYVGEANKKIPNKAGVRLDVVDALKKLKIPEIRQAKSIFRS